MNTTDLIIKKLDEISSYIKDAETFLSIMHKGENIETDLIHEPLPHYYVWEKTSTMKKPRIFIVYKENSDKDDFIKSVFHETPSLIRLKYYKTFRDMFEKHKKSFEEEIKELI